MDFFFLWPSDEMILRTAPFNTGEVELQDFQESRNFPTDMNPLVQPCRNKKMNKKGKPFLQPL